MCKNCKVSEIGLQRQAELDAATQEMKRLGIPAYHGFLARYELGTSAKYTDEQRAVLERYNTATLGMKKLHEDYVWSLARQAVQEAKERGAMPLSIMHGDRREL